MHFLLLQIIVFVIARNVAICVLHQVNNFTVQRGGTVYIMASINNKVLYTGVTSDLFGRVQQHKQKLYPESFTARYNCIKLVYFETYSTIDEAIDEEKRIKGGSRSGKEKLVNAINPGWRDLWEEIKDW